MSEEKNRPPAAAYVVRNFEDKQGNPGENWVKVGVAWMHGDGKGFNVDIAPGISVSGKLVVRANKAKE